MSKPYTVYLTESGQKKVGDTFITTNEELLQYLGANIIVTRTNSCETYILRAEDIKVIKDLEW